MIKDRIDPIRIGEEVFYRILYNIFNDEDARNYYGFSQISCFTNSEGYPGWNLWFQGVSGAYQLELIQAQNIFEGERLLSLLGRGVVAEGRFVVRYFPNVDDPLLGDFSCLESLFRLSSSFDSTGTPTITGQAYLDNNYFVVGFLDFKVDIDRTFLELECIAPNRWKDVRVDGLLIENNQGEKCEIVSPGGIDRNLPGWEFAFVLFDKMISACCYTHKCLPVEVIVAEKEWIRFDIDADNTSLETLDDEIELYHLISVFNLTDTNIDLIDTNGYFQSFLNGLSAQGFSSVNTYKGSEFTAHDKINPGWWEAGKLRFSNVSAADIAHCCYQDH